MTIYCIRHQIELTVDAEKKQRMLRLPPLGRRLPAVRCCLLRNGDVEQHVASSEGQEKIRIQVQDDHGVPTADWCEVVLR